MSDYKILFIHIPKTGGTTLGNLIHPNLNIKNTTKKYSDIILSENEVLSVEHDYYKNYADTIGDSIKEYFIFSFVRNPFSRVFSLWRQCCSARVLAKNTVMSCDKSLTNTKYYIHNDQNKILFRKFIGCLYDERENIHLLGNTQTAFLCSKQINFIGKYESFEQHVKILIHMLNTHIKQPIFKYKNLHLNKKSTYINEYKEYYDKVTKKFVQQLFFSDFIIFDYDYHKL